MGALTWFLVFENIFMFIFMLYSLYLRQKFYIIFAISILILVLIVDYLMLHGYYNWLVTILPSILFIIMSTVLRSILPLPNRQSGNTYILRAFLLIILFITIGIVIFLIYSIFLR